MVYCTRLESVSHFWLREFESHHLRHTVVRNCISLHFFGERKKFHSIPSELPFPLSDSVGRGPLCFYAILFCSREQKLYNSIRYPLIPHRPFPLGGDPLFLHGFILPTKSLLFEKEG